MNILHNFIYNVFEIGSISLDEYLDTTVFNHPIDFTKSAFKECMFKQFNVLPEVLQWVKMWKKETAFPLFAVSNESRELNDYRIKTFKLTVVFDGFFS